MIHESAPWKDRLAKDADFIDRWAAKPKITERRSVLIEQKTFVAAYSIRKLLQAGKLSSSFEGRSVPCDAAPLVRGKKIDRYNAHRYVELYDFDKMARQAISAPALLDLLIHSLLFAEPSPKTIGSPGFSSPLIVSAQRYGWSISMRTPSSCAKLLQTTRTRGTGRAISKQVSTSSGQAAVNRLRKFARRWIVSLDRTEATRHTAATN